MIITGERVAQWVSHKLSFGLCPPYYAIGTEINGTIINGCILNMFEGADTHFTCAGKGWSPEVVHAIGRYVFEVLGCVRMTAITESEDVAKLACKLGGKREGVMEDHFGEGRDAIVCGVLKRNWRYARIPAIQ